MLKAIEDFSRESSVNGSFLLSDKWTSDAFKSSHSMIQWKVLHMEPQKINVEEQSHVYTTKEVRGKFVSVLGKIRFIFTVIGMGTFSIGFGYLEVFLISYLVEWLQTYLQLSSSDAGFVYSLSMASGSIGLLSSVIVMGAWSDDFRSRFGNRAPFIFMGSFGAGVLLIITPFIVAPWNVVIVVPLVMGLVNVALGAAISPHGALLSELFTMKERGWVGLVLAAAATIGTGLGLFTLGEFATSGNPFLAWGTSGLAIIAGSLLTFLLIPKTNPSFPPKDSVFKDIINTPKYLIFFGKGDYGYMFIVQLFWGLAIAGVTHYAVPYIIDFVLTSEMAHGLEESAARDLAHAYANISLLTVGITAALLAAPVGIFISKYGKVKTAIVGTSLYAMFSILLAIEAETYNELRGIMIYQSGDLVIHAGLLGIFITAVLGGLGSIFITSVQLSLPADLVPEGKEAQFMGISLTAHSMSKPFLAVLAAYVFASQATTTFFGFEMEGYQIIFLVAGMSMFVALLSLFAISYERMLVREYYRYYKRYLRFQKLVESSLARVADRFL